MFRGRHLTAVATICALSGCAGLASLGSNSAGLTGQLTGLTGQIDELLPTLLLQKYVVLHNLRVNMDAIDAASGPVMMTTMTPAPPVIIPVPPPPIVPTPVPKPVPAPVPVPAPTPPPIVVPN